MFSINTPGNVNGDLPWLRVIHAANDLDSEMFGEPIKNENGVEVYAHASVIHQDDDTVTVEATSGHGDTILTMAARNAGLTKLELNDKDALRLAELLARYAAVYGPDCDGEMTVKQLADDLVGGNTDPSITTRIEEARDAIYDGLNQ